jgi:hypothetical protein
MISVPEIRQADALRRVRGRRASPAGQRVRGSFSDAIASMSEE